VIQSVEANSITALGFEGARGTMQLSWDMNLNSGLQICGTRGEFWIPVGPLDLLFSRKPGGPWQREKVKEQWPLDLEPKHGQWGCPVDYNECFNFQLVQTLRAVRLGEPPAATGEEGLATMNLIASAYKMTRPLEKSWLSPSEIVALEKNH